MLQDFMMVVELVLLVLIWLDGRIMRDSAIRVEKMYERWFEQRNAEREARRESARKARETKAAKNVVSESLVEVRTNSSVGRQPD